MPQQRKPYLLDPYLPESPLQQQYSRNIYSPVQGFAELAGNLGEAYLNARKGREEEEEDKYNAKEFAKIYMMNQDPTLAKDQRSGALYSPQDFGGLPTEKIDPMSWQQRGAETIGRLSQVDPRLASQNAGMLMQSAQAAQPPKPKYGQPMPVKKGDSSVLMRFSEDSPAGVEVPGVTPEADGSPPRRLDCRAGRAPGGTPEPQAV